MHDHHVIVRKVDYEDETLSLTGLDEPLREDKSQAKVVTQEKDFDNLKGSLYTIKYGKGETFKKGKIFYAFYRTFTMLKDSAQIGLLGFLPF